MLPTSESSYPPKTIIYCFVIWTAADVDNGINLSPLGMSRMGFTYYHIPVFSSKRSLINWLIQCCEEYLSFLRSLQIYKYNDLRKNSKRTHWFHISWAESLPLYCLWYHIAHNDLLLVIGYSNILLRHRCTCYWSR